MKRALVAASALFFLNSIATGQNVDDATLFRNYEYACEHNVLRSSRAELKISLCRTLEQDRENVRYNIRKQVNEVCRNIARQCASQIDKVFRQRLSQLAQQLSCAAVAEPTNCLYPDEAKLKPVSDPRGDVALVIAFIDAFEQAGARVPRGLKIGIRLYAEALEVGHDASDAIDRINDELEAFNKDVEKGCREIAEGPVNECTAAIDRQYMARNYALVLGWSARSPAGGESVVREIARKAVDRWANNGR
jgi:hypothetical protein